MSDNAADPAAEAEQTIEALQAQAQAAQADAEARAHALAPEGYSIRWPKPAYDLLRADDKAAEVQWLVRCNAHGTTKPAKTAREGDKLGTAAARQGWCKRCKADAAKAAKAR